MLIVYSFIQLEEKRQVRELAVNEGASVSIATVVAPIMSTASIVYFL